MKKRHLLILFAALVLLVLGTTAALAADGTKQVGLVISFPDGKNHTEIVTVPVTATTYDILQQAKIELIGANGQFGPAVCSINKTGCPASNCFCDATHFWAFYHLDPATGQWVVSQEGVGAAVPAGGAVEGFIWSEMDASFNPIAKPPVVTFAELQAQAPSAATAGAQAAAPTKLPTTGMDAMATIWLMAVALAMFIAGIFLAWQQREALSER